MGVEIALRHSLVVVALVQAVIFAIVVALPAWRTVPARSLLVLLLVLFGLMKFDQLLQLLAHGPIPGIRVVSATQWLIAPSLYLLICARTVPGFRFRAAHFFHAGAFLVVMAAEVAAAMAGTGFAGTLGPLVRGMPFYVSGVVYQLAYLGAALHVLKQHGLELRHFYSRTAEREVVWPQRLILLWIFELLLHLLYNFGRQFAAPIAVLQTGMIGLNLLHIALVNGLFFVGVGEFLAGSDQPQVVPRYPRSGLTPASRAQLFERVGRAVDEERLFLDPDLSVADLAARLASSPREVSEAINAVSGRTFFEFVNAKRIDEARRRLAADPGLRILDVAMESGFNSKSAFNNAFRRFAGTTPSAFRKRPLSDA